MEFILDKIAEIQRDSNTAQMDLESRLTKMPKSATELILTEASWSGDLDFAILHQRGFHHITSIEIYKADITRVDNLPLHLERFVCKGNLLVRLEKLPKSLLELDVANNYLETLDIANCPLLEKLIVSNNQLQELAPLGENLITLECERNHLAILDLLRCKSLKRLYCSHNPRLTVKDPPESLTDFMMDNDPFHEVVHPYQGDARGIEERMEYREALQWFFKKKEEYENKVNDMKKKAYEKEAVKKDKKKRAAAVKAPCINCKRKVGTIFSAKDKKYRAVCGDIREPCSLNIQIFSGYASNATDILYQFKDQVEDWKEQMIRQKMDTLFLYLDEKKSATLFQKNLEEYRSTNLLYREMLESHQEQYDNPYTKELIRRKEVEIYDRIQQIRELVEEYDAKRDIETEEVSAQTILHTIINQYKELANQRKALQALKYPLIQVDEDNITGMAVLHTFPVPLADIDYMIGDTPHVVKFIHTK